MEIATVWESLAARVEDLDEESIDNLVILLLHIVEWYMVVGKFPTNRNELIDSLMKVAGNVYHVIQIWLKKFDEGGAVGLCHILDLGLDSVIPHTLPSIFSEYSRLMFFIPLVYFAIPFIPD